MLITYLSALLMRLATLHIGIGDASDEIHRCGSMHMHL